MLSLLLDIVYRVSRGCIKDVWRVFGRCLERVQEISDSNWKVSGEYSKHPVNSGKFEFLIDQFPSHYF